MRNTTTTNLPSHPFWRYSLHVYSNDDVKNVLLLLQQAHHLNINVILFCCWTGFNGYGRMTRKELQLILTDTTFWHEKVTGALRHLRHRINSNPKQPWASLIREATLTEELEAEHVEQLLLTDLMTKTKLRRRSMYQCLADAHHNILLYCKLMQTPLDQDDNNAFYILLCQTFPKIEAERVAKLCSARLAIFDPNKTSSKQLSLDL